MSNEHREQAREIVRKWSADTFERLQGGESLYLPRGSMTALTHTVASALSSRDAEVREVLEGLRHSGDCWCPDGQLMVHSGTCLAARALWEKVQER